MNSLAIATGNKCAPLKERGHDCYQTPPEATRALLALEELPLCIWEPACGPGAIVQILRTAGHSVYASDVEDYGWPHHVRVDFLMEHRVPRQFTDIGPQSIDTIITNPPFKLATKFIRHSIELCPNVIMLMRVAAIAGQQRHALINDHLARVHVFSRRLPMMHREGWQGKKATSAMDYAWFIFERGHSAPAQIQSIDWKDYQ